MVEHKKFNSKFKDVMVQMLHSLSQEEWLKYSYALVHKLLNAKDYQKSINNFVSFENLQA